MQTKIELIFQLPKSIHTFHLYVSIHTINFEIEIYVTLLNSR